MAKKTVISEETREFRKEFFEWLQTIGVEEGYIRKDWKSELIEYIWQKMKEEGKEVKKESIRRNLNRMIAFYYNTGAQARSGKLYWKYIESWYLENVKQVWETRMMIDLNCSLVAHFLKLEHAKDYKSEINVLFIVPNLETETIDIWRYYPEPKIAISQ